MAGYDYTFYNKYETIIENSEITEKIIEEIEDAYAKNDISTIMYTKLLNKIKIKKHVIK